MINIGINWDYQKRISDDQYGNRWWFIFTIELGLFRLGFRFRTKIKPYFINYSQWTLINEFPDFDRK